MAKGWLLLWLLLHSAVVAVAADVEVDVAAAVFVVLAGAVVIVEEADVCMKRKRGTTI